MTYRKDLLKLGGAQNGGLTGKLSWNMGKKFGTEICSLSLPRDDDDCDDGGNGSSTSTTSREEVVEKFWSGLESAANRLISESGSGGSNSGAIMKIIKFDSEDEALSKLGNGIMDVGQLASREKRIKKEKKKAAEGGGDNSSSEQVAGSTAAVSVGQIIQQNDNDNSGGDELFALSMLHGHNLIPLSQLGQIKILRSNPRNESNIVCNKKKCEVTIKFCVLPGEKKSKEEDVSGGGAATNVVEGADLDDMTTSLIEGSKAMSKDIRLEEGLNYEVWRQQLRMEAVQATTSTTKTTTS